jgi:hypothetical protein
VRATTSIVDALGVLEKLYRARASWLEAFNQCTDEWRQYCAALHRHRDVFRKFFVAHEKSQFFIGPFAESAFRRATFENLTSNALWVAAGGDVARPRLLCAIAQLLEARAATTTAAPDAPPAVVAAHHAMQDDAAHTDMATRLRTTLASIDAHANGVAADWRRAIQTHTALVHAVHGIAWTSFARTGNGEANATLLQRLIGGTLDGVATLDDMRALQRNSIVKRLQIVHDAARTWPVGEIAARFAREHASVRATAAAAAAADELLDGDDTGDQRLIDQLRTHHRALYVTRARACLRDIALDVSRASARTVAYIDVACMPLEGMPTTQLLSLRKRLVKVSHVATEDARALEEAIASSPDEAQLRTARSADGSYFHAAYAHAQQADVDACLLSVFDAIANKLNGGGGGSEAMRTGILDVLTRFAHSVDTHGSRYDKRASALVRLEQRVVQQDMTGITGEMAMLDERNAHTMLDDCMRVVDETIPREIAALRVAVPPMPLPSAVEPTPSTDVFIDWYVDPDAWRLYAREYVYVAVVRAHDVIAAPGQLTLVRNAITSWLTDVEAVLTDDTPLKFARTLTVMLALYRIELLSSI